MLRVEVKLLDLDIEYIGDAREARGGVEDGEQFLLLFDTDLQISSDGVGELGGLVHTHGGDDGFVVERLLQLDVLLEERSDALHQLFDGGGYLEVGFAGAHGGHEKAVAVCHVDGLCALYALDQYLDIAVRHFDALHDVADGADLEDLLALGSSIEASCWVARKILRSPVSASSSARTLESRPTTKGVIMYGKITMSRMGIMGSLRARSFRGT